MQKLSKVQGKSRVDRSQSSRNSGFQQTSASGETRRKPNCPASPQPQGFFDTVKTFLNSAITMVGTAIGILGLDNAPYEQLLNDLNTIAQSSPDPILARAEHILKKLEKKQEGFQDGFIDHVKKNIDSGKNAWEGLKHGMGVSMSSTLGSLGQDDLAKEIYYQNIAAYQWAQSQLARYRGEVKKIFTFIDQDNTWSSKPDPSDTVEFQSEKKLFWGKQIIEIAPELGILEHGHSARVSVVTSRSASVPEGLSKRRTIVSEPSLFLEKVGYSIESQLEGSDKCAVIGLNGTVVHKPGEKTKLAPELIEGAILYQLYNSPGAPRINGKTFIEALRDFAIKKGFSVFIPKALPRLFFDSELSMGKLYIPHYYKIMKLKQECVDKKLERLAREGKEITDEEIKNAWLEFKQAVKDSIDISSGIDKEKIWLPGADRNLSEEPSKLCNLLQEYLPDLKIQKSKFLGCVNYKELLEKKPQAFFEVLTQGIEDAFVFHFFNNHGTPIKGAPQDLLKIYDAFNKLPGFRRITKAVSCALSETFEGKYLRKSIREAADKNKTIYIENGTKAYLDHRIANYLMHNFKKEELQHIRYSNGNMFDCGKELSFSTNFLQEGEEIYKREKLGGYIKWLKEHFEKSGGPVEKAIPVIETFFPQHDQYSLDSFDAKDKRVREIIARAAEIVFYPSKLYSKNSTLPYDETYSFYAKRNIVDKSNELNPHAQYYNEDQLSEKHTALPTFEEVLAKNLLINVAGDSEGDISMMAKALESSGFVDIVFNQFQDRKIFENIIKQRLKYHEEFKNNDELYQRCRKQFGICALEKNDSNGKYRKVSGFNSPNGTPNYEQGEFTEDDLIKELEQKYRFQIIRNASPEAYIRRRAEIFGLLTGRNIELNPLELKRAEACYKLKQEGNKLSSQDEKLLSLYEYSVIRRFEGSRFPLDAPHFNVYPEWHGKDSKGDFVVYKSRSHGGKLVTDRGNSTAIELFDKDEKTLQALGKVEIYCNNEGNFVYLDTNLKEKTFTDLERLNDHVVHSRLLPEPSPPSGIFASKFLRSILGEKNLKKLVCNLPMLFQGLLKYSGLIMGAGAVVRLISPITFGLKDSTYKLGYWMSNAPRAVSAFGGALRGILNVHRYWNIAIGEMLNIIASFLPDGAKHALLGLGNFVLFLGRGQQAAQRQQRVNNHPVELLETNSKSNKFKELLKKYVDPRTYVRKVTELGTSLVTEVKEIVRAKGLRPLIGEIAGSILSAIITPIQMIKDVIKDPRLIIQIVLRQSEKSGGTYRAVPSPGHLMTLVGAVSGISALISGTIGRLGKTTESGFNRIGRWAVSLACGIPALGIIANAKEIMANTDGLPKIYRGLNGKDATYNPRAAGLLQIIAGIGFACSSLFDLSRKYVAPWFDLSNALYFGGASIEEGPNIHKTVLSELRASNKLYEAEPDYASRKVDFNLAA